MTLYPPSLSSLMYPQHEPMEATIDYLRNRHLTDEEITRAAAHPRRMDLGTQVVDWLRSNEEGLVTAALEEGMGALKSANGTRADIMTTLRQTATMVARQAALAMAIDNGERYYMMLADLQATFWVSKIEHGALQQTLETLRLKAARDLGGARGQLYSAWLKVGARTLALTARLAHHKDEILDAVVDQIAATPNVASAADHRHLLERVLLYSVQANMPNGGEAFYKLLRSPILACTERHDAPPLHSEAGRLLHDTTRRQALKTVLSSEFFNCLRLATRLLDATTDVRHKIDAATREAIGRWLGRFPKSSLNSDEGRTTAESLLHFLTQQALLSCTYGAIPDVIQNMTDFEMKITHLKLNGNEMADLFQTYFDVARDTFGGVTLGVAEENLRRICHYAVYVADLSENRDEALRSAAEKHERKFVDRYPIKPATEYMVRDQEFMLANIGIGTLPGGGYWSIGRFQIGLEYFLAAKLDPEMMIESFNLLELEARQRFRGSTNAIFLPAFKRIRRVYEAAFAMQDVIDRILNEAAETVFQKFGAEVDKWEDGRNKTYREMRAMLHTSMISEMPNGEIPYIRGLESFMQGYIELKMDPAMVTTTFSALTKAVAANLPKPHKDWVVPILQRGEAFVHVVLELANVEDPIVATPIHEMFSKMPPEYRSQHYGMDAYAVEDLRRVLRFSALGTLPNAQHRVIDGFNLYADVLLDCNFGAEGMNLYFEGLRKHAGKMMERNAHKTIAPVLDKALTMCVQAAELAPNLDAILDTVASQLASRHPVSAENMSDFTGYMRGVLRRSVSMALTLQIPDADAWMHHFLREEAAALRHTRVDATVVHDAFDLLDKAIQETGSRNVRKVLQKPLATIRDHLTLLVEINNAEASIVQETTDRVFNARGPEFGQMRHAREHGAYDERELLRLCALGGLPGSSRYLEAEIERLRHVAMIYGIDKNHLKEALEALLEGCKTRVTKGAAKELRTTLQKSIKAATA